MTPESPTTSSTWSSLRWSSTSCPIRRQCTSSTFSSFSLPRRRLCPPCRRPLLLHRRPRLRPPPPWSEAVPVPEHGPGQPRAPGAASTSWTSHPSITSSLWRGRRTPSTWPRSARWTPGESFGDSEDDPLVEAAASVCRGAVAGRHLDPRRTLGPRPRGSVARGHRRSPVRRPPPIPPLLRREMSLCSFCRPGSGRGRGRNFAQNNICGERTGSQVETVHVGIVF